MTETIREIRLALPTGPVDLAYRDGTKDRYTIDQVWKAQPYRLARFADVVRRGYIDEEYARILAEGSTPLIIDAGANIGASVLFLAHLYPQARIIALEPEERNYRLLLRNCGEHAAVTCLRAAIASRDGDLRLYDPGRSTDAYRVAAGDESGVHGELLGRVTASSVGALLREHGGGAAPLLMKIDIEGGESELFAHDTDWVDEFPAIAIELHDWMLPGVASSAAFLSCVAARRRDFINPAGTDIVYSLRNPAPLAD